MRALSSKDKKLFDSFLIAVDNGTRMPPETFSMYAKVSDDPRSLMLALDEVVKVEGEPDETGKSIYRRRPLTNH